MDAAFCVMRGGSRVIDKLYLVRPISSVSCISREGEYIGIFSPIGGSAGYVLQFPVSVRYTGDDGLTRIIYDVVEASYSNMDGDCGGIVCNPRGIHGLHVGAGVVENARYSYYSLARMIEDVMDGSIY
ncbi:MAG: hypothetical protein KH111_04000 [Bacteroidales bacterium]|nr:hypothetical protein [Bacteroidales bacterium]